MRGVAWAGPSPSATSAPTCARYAARGGHSQEGFADLVGLDRTYVGSIERGERNPSLKAVLAIAEALGVEAGELFRAPA